MKVDWYWSKTHENVLVVMVKAEDDFDKASQIYLMHILDKFFGKERIDS